MIKKYLENIEKTTLHNDQREESYYPAVASLMSDFANSLNRKETSITILPKKTDAGNPDFRIWNGENKIVGYIEAKIPNTNLDKTEKSEQLKRYLQTFPNVILTNFYEFRLYRNSEIILKATLSQNNTTNNDLEKLLQKFFDFSLPKIFSAEQLATELAKRTSFLREEIITNELKNKENKNYIRAFYNAFKKYLIAGLKEEEFADLYSQTITYGMFAAKTRAKHDQNFTRKNVVDNIPKTIGILRDVFEFISLGNLPKQMEIIIDDIAEILNISDATKLLNDFYKQGKGDDPIIHFYETFLNKYDPSTREKRGVYYTPEAVVKYIINSVDEILIKDFNKIGFADSSVKVLDPAGGTLTFLAEATKKAITTFTQNFGNGNKKDFIKQHILKNFYGFEIMMSPYSIAHLKMSYLLQEEGYEFEGNDRFQLYLSNTLETKELEQAELPLIDTFSEEAKQANTIKKQTEIIAIIGNPPYSFDSANKNLYINEMDIYKKGVENEKNLKILSDDYLKFIRFCHKKIEQTNQGIISLITKNTYINIASAKGMRKQLLLTFDKIYILNLHGKLYEKTPEGNKDQNVFDIRVGTAIIFLVKTKKGKKKKLGKLFYKDLYGERAEKYKFLNENNIFSTFSKEDEVKIDETHFFFEKKNFKNPELYNKFFAIDEIFDKKNMAMGVSTHRDHFVIDKNKKVLEKRLQHFLNEDLSNKDLKSTYNLEENSDFKIEKVKAKFKIIDKEKLREYSFKPFDNKYIYYDKLFIDRNRISIMHNFIDKENLGLIITRRFADKKFAHAFVTNKITDFNFLAVGSYTIPLWIYKKNGDAFNGSENEKNKISNIRPEFEKLLQKNYDKKDITEQIFYYIYAVLFSNIYRNKFPELLKIDFPKIPFAKNVKIFEKIAKLGEKLINLHLLSSSKLNKPKVKFQGIGNSEVQKIKYDSKKNLIYINENQYFDNIKQDLWNFKIGKNQVIKKWFTNKNKIEFEDAIEFSKIATAIYETFNIQNKIDQIYPEIESELIEK